MILLPGRARAQIAGTCVKVEQFIEAIQDYKQPYTAAELTQMEAQRSLAAGQNPQERYAVPGLFEITMSNAASNDARASAPLQVHVKPQGYPRGFAISARSVWISGGDVLRPCPDDAATDCSGEGVSFVGDNAVASLWYLGAHTSERLPFLYVESADFCKADGIRLTSEQAVERLKKFLRGPRIP
ncbi:MAG: hypothetical protein ABL904_01255 [Hyphomicrobiaceae bacterium]